MSRDFVDSPAADKKTNDLTFQIVPDDDECNPTPGLYGHAFSPNGMSVALCDASVKNITPEMPPLTFTRALSPNDGQPLVDDWSE